MGCLQRKELFLLISISLLWLLLSPVASTTAGANSGETQDATNSRSKRDLNLDTQASSDRSLRNLVSERQQGSSGLTGDYVQQTGFGQTVQKRSVAEAGEKTKQKRLREFVGKRESSSTRQNGENVSSAAESGVAEDEESLDKRGHSFPAFRDTVKRKDNTVTKRSVDKRLRDFVGKRSDYNKRLRDFVGKRNNDAEFAYDKRLRDFVGKRDDNTRFAYAKRLRDFVGKRESAPYPFDVQKRLRDFVGKRDFVPLSFGVQKRLRDFVGKRNSADYSLGVGKRLRDFVGKRDFEPYPFDVEKRLRDFVGKRVVTPSFDLQKRLRDFVGKRDGMVLYPAYVQKRLRDFVGKRDGLVYPAYVQKRLRDFVGKRDSAVDPADVEKHFRDFVGKRDAVSYPGELQKRLRDFVGKRSAALYSSDVQKRLRDFVGKRSEEESAFRSESPVDLSEYFELREAGDRADEHDPSEDLNDRSLGDLEKRAPIREFVGKRTADLYMQSGVDGVPDVGGDLGTNDLIPLSDDDDDGDDDGDEEAHQQTDLEDLDLSVSKRLRDFVGKRAEMDKRLRDFVGKRDSMNRQLSGPGEPALASGASPVAAAAFPLSKRLRDFVGK